MEDKKETFTYNYSASQQSDVLHGLDGRFV